MKKRVMLFFVFALCFILIRGEAYAMPMGDTSINPLWIDKSSSRVNLTINHGTAVASAKLVGGRGTEKISATMYLQKKEGASWSTVKTWQNVSNGKDLSFSQSARISRGNTYRVRVRVTTKMNGKEVTSNIYSGTKNY